jgi:hypothetical protein
MHLDAVRGISLAYAQIEERFLAPQTPLVNDAIIPTLRAAGCKPPKVASETDGAPPSKRVDTRAPRREMKIGNAAKAKRRTQPASPTLFYGADGILDELSKQVNQINTRGCQ